MPHVHLCHGAAHIQPHHGIAPCPSAPLYSHLCLEMPGDLLAASEHKERSLCSACCQHLSTSPEWEHCPSCVGAVRVLCGWVDPCVSREEPMLSSWWLMRSTFVVMVHHHQQVKDLLGCSLLLQFYSSIAQGRCSAEEWELTRCRNELVSIH